MFVAFYSFIILLRVAELILAQCNRRWALAHGGREEGSRHYRLIVLVHILFYISVLLEWHYVSRGWSPTWPVWLGVLTTALILRLWAIGALGRYWNTRVIVVPGAKLVVRGPYRYVRHPNYVAVILEFLTIPMLCGAYMTAVVFSLANAWILIRRIPEEERALEWASGTALPPVPRFLPRLGRGRSRIG